MEPIDVKQSLADGAIQAEEKIAGGVASAELTSGINHKAGPFTFQGSLQVKVECDEVALLELLKAKLASAEPAWVKAVTDMGFAAAENAVKA